MDVNPVSLKKIGEITALLLKNKDYQKISRDDKIFDNRGENLRILRILCQRPYFTGSGINFVNLTEKSSQEGIDQFLIFGHPTGEKLPLKTIVDSKFINPVLFQNPDKPSLASNVSFPVAGMSDKMPYPSTKFSSFNYQMLEEYLKGFSDKIKYAIQKFKPKVIHTHHLWLITSLARVLLPEFPVIATCHNTALRQKSFANHLKPFVLDPIRYLDYIAINNQDQQKRVEQIYEFKETRANNFFIIGQGINDNLFYPSEKTEKVLKNEEEKYTIKKIIYVGKLSLSKGLLQLIKAFKQVASELEDRIKLYIVGSGIGDEKDKILNAAEEMEDAILFLGQLEQAELANRFRDSDLFILPSFYDGFPKVMLEALASGCKVIITDLPGVKETMQQQIEGSLQKIHFLPLPKMKSIR